MLERLLVVCVLALAAQSAAAVTIYRFTDANGVVSFTDQPVPGAQVMKLRERMVERIDSQVRLNVKKAKGTDSLYVRNDLYAPVEIELKLSGVKNVVGVADQVIRRTIPARSNERLIALSPQVPGKATIGSGLFYVLQLKTVDAALDATRKQRSDEVRPNELRFNVITGVYQPEGGKVRFDSEDITGWAPARVASRGIAPSSRCSMLAETMVWKIGAERVVIASTAIASRWPAGP